MKPSVPNPVGHPVDLNPGSVGNPDGRPGPRTISPNVAKALGGLNPEAAAKVRDAVARKVQQQSDWTTSPLATGVYAPATGGKYSVERRFAAPAPPPKG
jgi:hypothetical protein